MNSHVSVREHYDNHLANFYSWMTGDFREAAARFKMFLTEQSIIPRHNKIAVDLGAGHGIQTVPLAELGFDVMAVDFNQQLLDELQANANGLSVTVRHADVRKVAHEDLTPELIVCCGDTFSHLESKAELETFVADLSRMLIPEGKIILSFRDHANALTGSNRIIPVRSTEDRILTCILDYETDFVNVTDLLYERNQDRWEMKASTYRKIRLRTEDVLGMLERNGLTVEFQEVKGGMVMVAAGKETHSPG